VKSKKSVKIALQGNEPHGSNSRWLALEIMRTSKLKKLSDTFGKILKEIPEFTYIGNMILRQKTAKVDLQEGISIGSRLKITLEKYRNIAGFGRGLAAPQIGENKSVFVTFIDDKFKTYINPKIMNPSEKSNLYRETCLSCGFLSIDVKRPESVTIEYLNENGENIREEVGSFIARLLQHEYDHLKGIVNIDKAEPASIEFMINDPLKEQLREI